MSSLTSKGKSGQQPDENFCCKTGPTIGSGATANLCVYLELLKWHVLPIMFGHNATSTGFTISPTRDHLSIIRDWKTSAADKEDNDQMLRKLSYDCLLSQGWSSQDSWKRLAVKLTPICTFAVWKKQYLELMRVFEWNILIKHWDISTSLANISPCCCHGNHGCHRDVSTSWSPWRWGVQL